MRFIREENFFRSNTLDAQVVPGEKAIVRQSASSVCMVAGRWTLWRPSDLAASFLEPSSPEPFSVRFSLSASFVTLSFVTFNFLNFNFYNFRFCFFIPFIQCLRFYFALIRHSKWSSAFLCDPWTKRVVRRKANRKPGRTSVILWKIDRNVRKASGQAEVRTPPSWLERLGMKILDWKTYSEYKIWKFQLRIRNLLKQNEFENSFE